MLVGWAVMMRKTGSQVQANAPARAPAWALAQAQLPAQAQAPVGTAQATAALEQVMAEWVVSPPVC
jgi:hypothetical protein